MANHEHVEVFKKVAGLAKQRGVAIEADQLDLSDVVFAELSNSSVGDEFGEFQVISSRHLRDANLRNASLDNVRFIGCDFTRADLSNASCRDAFFDDCTFADADFEHADMNRAIMRKVNLAGVRNAEAAKGLETVRVISDVYNFESCERSLQAKWLSWEVIRNVGRLRIFAVSISLLGAFIVAVQWAGMYNDQVRAVVSWADQISIRGSEAERLMGQQIQEHLRPFSFSLSTTWLFVSVVLLGVASTLYNVACPSEIKEFTRSQWEHELKKNVLQYWTLAWKRRHLRYASAAFYLIGGSAFLIIMARKLYIAFSYIAGYGKLLPF